MATLQVLIVASALNIVYGIEVAEMEVQMSQVCGGLFTPNGMYVMYPNTTTPQRFPVLAYAHGWKAGGDRVEPDMRQLFTLLATAGYIVVAPKTPYDHSVLSWCFNQHKDLYSALEWAQTSEEMRGLVNETSPAGIFGHSMGGRSTSIAATLKDKPEFLKIGAAVMMHPACTVLSCGHADQIAVPSMLIAGQKDTQIPPKVVRSYYDDLPTALPRAYVEAKGVAHTDPETYHQPNRDGIYGMPPRIENHYVLDWMNCFLKKNDTACALAQCQEPQASSPTSACTFNMMPGIDRDSLIEGNTPVLLSGSIAYSARCVLVAILVALLE